LHCRLPRISARRSGRKPSPTGCLASEKEKGADFDVHPHLLNRHA
jgi:hypothetical protein